ncbi:MAG: NTP transferase domain-containing protein [Patescibacteria group bacterium]|jgi:bifunctional N-acetylglucosamine-1-phosphate-uridyltransferase/glucosamine-1-phosphate-acetyltransferase GlmU-like protein
MQQIIVMAAGRGTRMKSELPKVLVPLKGRPMLDYLLGSISKTAQALKPIIIVSPDNKEVIAAALKKYDVQYVIQEQQLGTGHAVASARNYIDPRATDIFVLNGDHPFYKVETIRDFPLKHQGILSMITVALDNFEGWRSVFHHWGRVVRDKENNAQRIVEFKDAADHEKEILEVNPNCFCFNKEWLFAHIDTLNNQNNQGEYYITDLVKIAFNEGHKVTTFSISPHEGVGVNSLEELQIAEDLLEFVEKNF